MDGGLGWMVALPGLCRQDTEEGEVAGGEVEAGATEGCPVIGEMGDAEAGEEAKGEVQKADEGAGGQAEEAGRDAEVGDEPAGFGGEVGEEAGGELVELRLGEAVEKEVGDDEVVGPGAPEGEGVGGVGAQAKAGGGGGGLRSLAEEVEHDGAEIDRVGQEAGVAGERRARKRPSPSPRTRARRVWRSCGRKWRRQRVRAGPRVRYSSQR